MAWNSSRWIKELVASYLMSATTLIDVKSAAAPTTGQVLTATGDSAATWQGAAAASQIATSGAEVDIATTPPVAGQILGADSVDAASWQAVPPVSQIATSGAAVTVASAAPSAGQILTADSSTAASWQAAGAASDANAIHDNVAAEINAITEKTTASTGDQFLIEDSSGANAKKKLTLANILGKVVASFIPDSHDTYDLGSLTKRWYRLYVDRILAMPNQVTEPAPATDDLIDVFCAEPGGPGDNAWTLRARDTRGTIRTMGEAAIILSATTRVDVESATAPTSGQVLTATGASAATWQTPAAPAGLGFGLSAGDGVSAGTTSTMAIKAGSLGDTTNQLAMPAAGSLRYLALNMNDGGGRTAGDAGVWIQKSTDGGDTFSDLWGSTGTKAVQLDGTNTEVDYASASAGTYSFAAGDVLRFRQEVDAAWTTDSSDHLMECLLLLELD